MVGNTLPDPPPEAFAGRKMGRRGPLWAATRANALRALAAAYGARKAGGGR